MSIYDDYSGVQIKIRAVGRSFMVGMRVPLKDGVYLGYEGVVVIVGNIFVRKFLFLTSKWGDRFRVQKILDGYNPIAKAVKAKHWKKRKGEHNGSGAITKETLAQGIASSKVAAREGSVSGDARKDDAGLGSA
jgi:hypothetical protein